MIKDSIICLILHATKYAFGMILRKLKTFILLFSLQFIIPINLSLFACCNSKQISDAPVINLPKIQVGAQQMDLYIPLIQQRNVAIVANHSSLVNGVHLVDTLLSLKVLVKKIFCPEHGFRGIEDDGKNIPNEIDKTTGLPIISLYGSRKEPTTEDLKDVDVMLFDIQDVGVRYYTYISTLHYVMKACAENNIPLIVLDRPNPNGFYIDGPVLEESFQSFVGMHSVPIVYGMTIGEYALMINGENWIRTPNPCSLTVIPCNNYTHDSLYVLPVKPSPNLKSMNAIYLYPTTCLFEGTVLSVGRGTNNPFEIFGHPDYKKKTYSFTPKKMQGANNPKFENQVCYGEDVYELAEKVKNREKKIMLSLITDAYKNMGEDVNFFTPFFDKLAGTAQLKYQIMYDLPEDEIRFSWQPRIEKFKVIRQKYLLYKDFESSISN